MMKRWKLSDAQRADIWNRWKAGQSLHAIGRALGKDHVVIRFLLAHHGGIAPPARHRSRRVLTLACHLIQGEILSSASGKLGRESDHEVEKT